MNRKVLVVLIPLVLMLSLLVMPAFATPATTFPSIKACGWAYEKTSSGYVSGSATLYVVFGTAPDAVPAVTDNLNEGFILLEVKGQTFEWVIDLSSVKLKCDVLTQCATPYVHDDVSSNVPEPTSPLSPINVVIDLCKPYCVTAYGCSTFFTGQGHILTAV